MNFSDLTTEFIKTIMATQRLLITKFGYAVSFMGDEQDLTSGDGINTFEIRVYKHNLKTKDNLDFFKLGTNADIIDFKNLVFKMNSVPRQEIEEFFKAFIV